MPDLGVREDRFSATRPSKYDAAHLVDLVLGDGPHIQTLRDLGLRDAMADGLRSGLSPATRSAGRSGYNPDEPRDWHGRWTTGGSTGRAAPEGRWTDSYGLYGGRLIRIQNGDGDEPGIGHNSLPGEDDELPEDEARPGFEPSGHAIGGLVYQDHPLLDGKPWPTVSHDLIKAVLVPQGRVMPTMQIYVPQNGHGPLLVGSNTTTDFPPPPAGYDAVTLKGIPQVTYSHGEETNHAPDSIEAALAMAVTNRCSEVYFNRSISVSTGRIVQSSLRPDVFGVLRPEIDNIERYFPHEILSPGQKARDREKQMPTDPRIGRLRHSPEIKKT